jgi:IS66 C-terminal element/Transposase IS66 family
VAAAPTNVAPSGSRIVDCALSRWEGLTRFIDDGRIELGNNTGLNRKNALFTGSDGGAEHRATTASLIETCKLNDVDPLGYLTDVRPHQDRQRSSKQRHRSADAVGLPKARPQTVA